MSFDERMLNGMGVLSAIVDSGSFAAATEALDMSQSGVSRSVARLEARLGIRLFDRTTRSVKLTDEGRRFYEQIVPPLAVMTRLNKTPTSDLRRDYRMNLQSRCTKIDSFACASRSARPHKGCKISYRDFHQLPYFFGLVTCCGSMADTIRGM